MFKNFLCGVVAFFFFTFSFVSAETKLVLTSKSTYLIEASTGEVLYAENENESLRPASVTKVMTLLLIMEALENGSIKIDDMVSCSERARKMGGSQIWLDEREQLSVSDMLKAICVVSANDCCVAMSEFIAGSEETFVEKMNQRAKELGMDNTTFKNCHGIDEEGHITTAHDISLMSKELVKHEKIFEYTTIWMDSLRDGKSELVNTNKLIRFYSGANGLKTGSTSLAKYNLSASAKRGDMQLIGVVMACPTSKERQADATKLLDYGFANYSIEIIDEQEKEICEVSVRKGEKEKVIGIIREGFSKLLKKGESKNIEKEIVIYDVNAPIKKGDKVGELLYKQEGIEIGKRDIVAKEDIEKNTFGKIFACLIVKWAKIGR